MHSSLASKRLELWIRLVTAIVGGYGVAHLITLALVAWLPLEPAQKVQIGFLLVFLIYAAVLIWVFASHSLWRVWRAFLLITLIAGTGLWLQGMR